MDAVRRNLALALLLGLAALLESCGGDDNGGLAGPTTSPSSTPTVTSLSPAGAANACPHEGCRARITSVTKTGEELEVRLEANYSPDMARNHYHVFWDTWTARQVSDDAEPRFGVRQGEWVPTSDNPFITQDAVSVRERGASKRICVTTGDRDHKVLDPELVDCRDVSGLV